MTETRTLRGKAPVINAGLQQVYFDLQNSRFPATDIILSTYRGSLAHGMHNPSPDSIDDIDIMSVVVPSLPHYLGLKSFGSRGTIDFMQTVGSACYDCVVYELLKFVHLLVKGNPNVLTILWTEPRHHLIVTPAGQMLLDNRDIFLTKEIFGPFMGYAKSQMHKMTSPNTYQGYMGEKRKRLVDKYGYDTKNAAHLIRLLRMLVEALKYGTLFVDRKKRGDDLELLNIKNGGVSLDDIHDKAYRIMYLAEQEISNSRLPDRVDMDRANAVAVGVIKTALRLTEETDVKPTQQSGS